MRKENIKQMVTNVGSPATLMADVSSVSKPHDGYTLMVGMAHPRHCDLWYRLHASSEKLQTACCKWMNGSVSLQAACCVCTQKLSEGEQAAQRLWYTRHQDM
jgi:hypothetical protein